ncbi:unknown [[Mannheimia] succiniciproducens MBEL55E]|uniref:Uncharacterized protein n=1 Tax=Mannheimia succiniciproducens (strain KCTC 0769BP / MBEL55E) TaxID=221988 RepID=Q65Q90_MANSM|nr:unknown [[Mannheimia] succiniciproducens MBEL55E]
MHIIHNFPCLLKRTELSAVRILLLYWDNYRNFNILQNSEKNDRTF